VRRVIDVEEKFIATVASCDVIGAKFGVSPQFVPSAILPFENVQRTTAYNDDNADTFPLVAAFLFS